MRVAFFSAQSYERAVFDAVLQRTPYGELSVTYLESRLSLDTVVLAQGSPLVCAFVCDDISAPVVEKLHSFGTRMIALHSAGFNHVNLDQCRHHGIRVARVPAYSPYAVAEHTVCLLLALNRKVHRAYQRVKELNFSLDGLVGFDVHGKTVGVIGTGKIGTAFVHILRGFGAHILAYDPYPSEELRAVDGFEYVTFEQLMRRSDIISLHCPLTPDTRHLINSKTLQEARDGVIILNTSRGALIDTKALIYALKTGKVGAAGLDVYEEEEGVFFSDLSQTGISDDVLARLLTFPNVLVTAHQAFLTREALRNIAERTVLSLYQFLTDSIDANARLV
jgi:D-lactate dehydrogenase